MSACRASEFAQCRQFSDFSVGLHPPQGRFSGRQMLLGGEHHGELPRLDMAAAAFDVREVVE